MAAPVPTDDDRELLRQLMDHREGDPHHRGRRRVRRPRRGQGGLRRIQGSRGPYGLPIAQLLLKLPAGALIALFALVIVQSGGIPSIKPVGDGQLVAYAAIFGLVQESVTRTIDKRANDLIGAARDQNDPQRPVTGAAGATPST